MDSMPRPLFSVVIPVGDHTHLLPLAVQSVLQQTWSELEVWLMAPVSTAELDSSLRQLSQQDTRIHVLTGGKPQDLAKKLKGRYVAYLNDVDLWFPTHLDTMAQELRSHDFVHSLAAEVGVDGQVGVSTLYLPTANRALKTGYQGRRPFLSNIAHLRHVLTTQPTLFSLLLTPETLDVDLWGPLFDKARLKVRTLLQLTSLHLHYRSSTRTQFSKQVAVQQAWWQRVGQPEALREVKNEVFDSIMNRYAAFEQDVLKQQVHILTDSALPREEALKLIQTQSLELRLKEAQILALETSLYKAIGTRGWKVLEFYRHFIRRLAFLRFIKRQWFTSPPKEINAWDNRIQHSSVTIIIPVFNGYEQVVQTVFAVLSNTLDPTVSILIINDRSTDPKTTAFLAHLATYSDRFNIFILTPDHNGGFVESCNLGMERTTSDVVLLNSDTIVTKNWLTEIQAVSTPQSVATVTPLSNNATILSLPLMNEENQMPSQLSYLNRFASKLAKVGGKRSLEIPTGHGFCLFIKRAGLNEVGLFDEVFSPGYGEENDLCQRLHKAGWENRAALKSFVYHWGGSSFNQEKFALQTEHQFLIQQRHPEHELAVNQFQHQDPLRALRNKAAKVLVSTEAEQKKRLRVAVDGQILLSSGTTGTARYVRNIYHLLGRKEVAHSNVDAFLVTAATEFDEMIRRTDHLHKFFAFQTVDLVRYGFDKEIDIFHKPQQISTWEELYFFSLCPKRVITYLDLIAYRSPTYFPSSRKHQEYQQLTRASLEIADVILTISETVKQELVTELAIPAGKIVVTHLGVEPKVFEQTPSEREEKAWAKKFFISKPYLLYVGTDFVHKNVMKVIHTFAELKARGIFQGQLVLIVKAATGGELPQLLTEIKARQLEKDVTIVTDFVSDAELTLFYKRATLHLNFSLAEGFGFTPLEAALAGVASVLSPTAIYRETMGEAAFFPVKDEVESYVDVITLALQKPATIRQKARQARQRARQFTWQASMDKVLKVYKRLRTQPLSQPTWSRTTRQLVAKAKTWTVKTHTLA